MSNSHLKFAHDYGVQKALEQVGYKSAEEVMREAHALGLLKTADNHAGLGAFVGGPIGAALGADEGHRGSAALGSIGGSLGGAALGGAGGAGLGALLGLLAKNPRLGAQLGGLAGAGLGAAGGNIYGAQHYGG